MIKTLYLIDEKESNFILINNLVENTIYKNSKVIQLSLSEFLEEDLASQDLILFYSESNDKLVTEQDLALIKQRNSYIPIIILQNCHISHTIHNTQKLGVNDAIILKQCDAYALERSMSYAIQNASLQAQLAASEERFRLAVEDADAGIWDCYDTANKKIWVSDRLYEMIGIPNTTDLGGGKFYDYVHPADRESVRQKVINYREKGISMNSEFRMIKSDGSVFWVNSRAKASRDTNNQASRLVGTLVDITKRKNAEILLKESEKRFELAIRGANAGIWEWRKEDGIEYEWWSPKYFEILGYEYNELEPGMASLTKLIHPDDIEKINNALNNHLEHNKPYEVKIRFITKSGMIKTLLCTGVSEKDEQSGKHKMVGSVIDISEQVNYHIQLNKSLERFKSMLQTAPTSAFIIQKGKMSYLNSVAEKTLNFKLDEIKDHNILSVIHPSDYLKLNEKIRQLYKGEKPSVRLTIRIKDSKGKYLYTDITLSIIEYKGEKAILGNGIDVTASKQYEIDLTNQKLFTESILNNLPLDIAVLDKNCNYLYVNKQAINDNELRKWIIGKTDLDYCNKKNIDKNIADFRQQKLQESIDKQQAVEWLDQYEKNGQSKAVLRTFYPIFEQNHLHYIIGYGFDISKQKLAEAKLRRRIEFEKLIIDLSNKLINIHQEQLSFFIEYALTQIGEFINVDRAFLYQLRELPPVMQLTHEWNHGDNEAIPKDNYSFATHDMPWWMKQLEDNETVKIYNALALPSQAYFEKECFEAQRTKSLLVVPLKFKKKVIGYLGFETTSNYRLWEDDVVNSLKISAQVFMNALEREKSQDALMANEKKFRTLTENAHAAIFISQNMRMVYANQSTLDLCGYSNDEMLSMSILDLFHPDEWSTSTQFAQELEQGIKQVSRSERKILHKSGEIKYLDITSNIIEYNKRQALISIAIDITEKKKAEKERTVLINKLTQQNKDLEQFSYITSHNLRAPIAGIKGLVSIIDREDLKHNGNLEIINRLEIAANNLDLIIKELNEVTAIKSQINESKQQVNLYNLANRIIQNHQTLITESKADIKLHLSTDLSFYSIASYAENILTNLLTNSIRYRQPDIKPEIHITCYKTLQGMHIEVSDNGRGIDLKRFRDKLFKFKQRFHFDVEGSGLGLYLVKTQVEALGGEISVVSKINIGSTFKVILPA